LYSSIFSESDIFTSCNTCVNKQDLKIKIQSLLSTEQNVSSVKLARVAKKKLCCI
jgi:hypothetical protein